MNTKIAAKIYDFLMEKVEAPKSWRDDFISHIGEGGREYRFRGNLGFGGKIYCTATSWRIGCYNEDITPERAKAIEEVNSFLKHLKDSHD